MKQQQAQTRRPNMRLEMTEEEAVAVLNWLGNNLIDDRISAVYDRLKDQLKRREPKRFDVHTTKGRKLAGLTNAYLAQQSDDQQSEDEATYQREIKLG